MSTRLLRNGFLILVLVLALLGQAFPENGLDLLPARTEIRFSDWTKNNRSDKKLAELREIFLAPINQAELIRKDEKSRLLITYWEDGVLDRGKALLEWKLTYRFLDDKQKVKTKKDYRGKVKATLVTTPGLAISVAFEDVKNDIMKKLKDSPPLPSCIR